MKQLLNSYYELPDILKNKFLLRLFFGFVSLIVMFVVLFIFKNFYFWSPFLATAGFCIYIAFSLLWNYQKGEIIKLEGNCAEVLMTITKTKAKRVFFDCEDKRVRITLKEHYQKIQQGDYIVLYVKKSTPVYRDENCYIFNDYLAISITTVSSENNEKTSVLKEFMKLAQKK